MTTDSSSPEWGDTENQNSCLPVGLRFSNTHAVDSYMRLRGRAVKNHPVEAPPNPPSPPLRLQSSPPVAEAVEDADLPIPDLGGTVVDADVPAVVPEPSTESTIPPDETFTYIASTRLIQNTKLVGIMKRDYAIRLEERDYEYLKPFVLDVSHLQEIPEADLIIDFRTALVYYPILDLCQTHSLPSGVRSGIFPLLRLLVQASTRYEVLWAVVNASTCGRRDALTPPIRQALGRLCALSAALGERLQLEVRVVVGFSAGELAKFARKAGDMARREVERAAAQGRIQGGWGKRMPWNSRDFLGPDGLHEHFLCSLGLGSFAAQTLLTLCSLRELLSIGRQKKAKGEDTGDECSPSSSSLLGWVPDRVVNRLRRLTLTPFCGG